MQSAMAPIVSELAQFGQFREAQQRRDAQTAEWRAALTSGMEQRAAKKDNADRKARDEVKGALKTAVGVMERAVGGKLKEFARANQIKTKVQGLHEAMAQQTQSLKVLEVAMCSAKELGGRRAAAMEERLTALDRSQELALKALGESHKAALCGVCDHLKSALLQRAPSSGSASEAVVQSDLQGVTGKVQRLEEAVVSLVSESKKASEVATAKVVQSVEETADKTTNEIRGLQPLFTKLYQYLESTNHNLLDNKHQHNHDLIDQFAKHKHVESSISICSVSNFKLQSV